MIPVDHTSPEFNNYLVSLNLPVVSMMDLAGHKIVLARGSLGPSGSRRMVVMVCLDDEAEVVEGSAVELIGLVAATGRLQRATNAPDRLN